jgi:hypothetical protein
MSARRKTSGFVSIQLRGHMRLRIEYDASLSDARTAEIARLYSDLMAAIDAHCERWRAISAEAQP